MNQITHSDLVRLYGELLTNGPRLFDTNLMSTDDRMALYRDVHRLRILLNDPTITTDDWLSMLVRFHNRGSIFSK